MSSFSSMPRIPKKRKTDEQSSDQKPEKQAYQPSPSRYPGSSMSGNSGRSGSMCQIMMNGFELTLNKFSTVFKYQITFNGVFRTRSGEDVTRELINKNKDDVSVQIHRRMLWDVFQSLLKQDQHLFGANKHRFAYDCGLQFYSMESIFSDSDTKNGTVDTSELAPDSKAHLSRALQRIEYEIKKCGEISMEKFDSLDKDRSLQQFLEVLTSQGLYASGNENLIYRNQRYNLGEREEIVRADRDAFDYPFCIKLGSAKSVCISEQKNGSSKPIPILQLEKKTSPFFPEMRVIDFVNQCANRDPSVYGKVLHGLMVKTTHMQHPRTFRIHSLSDESCERITFIQGDKEVSVPDYFRAHHNMEISGDARRSPCVIQMNKRGGQQEFNNYPMDCLQIIKGQRIFDKKQNPKIVDELIKRARVLPNAMARAVEEELNQKILVGETKNYLKEFGVGVCNELFTAPAKLLEAPKIEYARSENKALTTNNGQKNAWKIENNTQFFRPGTITNSKKGLNRWLFVAVNMPDITSNMRLNDTVQRFMERLISAAKIKGIQLDKPESKELVTRGMGGNDLYTEMSEVVGKYAHVEEVKFVIFVQRERKDIPRDTMKMLETKYKMTTQQITMKTVEKAVSDRGSQMVLDNLLMKTNEKLGGVNCRIRPPLKCQDWFRKGVMYIGLDISHPGIASVSPTVVGMAFTKNELLEVEGRIWYQEPREHLIQKMKEYIVEAIEEFKKHSKVYPDDIIVYRGGVSEGEFDKVPDVEISQFKEAFRDKRLAFQGGRKPSLKYISVQRNSGYRLMPKQSHNFNVKSDAVRENVLPGTCADTGVVNEARKEFVLVPHQAIQGTAKPSKYVLLHNDPKEITMEQLELVTNTLCYTHGIVTSPVSCPSILYQAGDLAKRGLNNYKSYTARRSSPIPPQEATEEREAYFDELCEKLRVTLDNRFWA